MSDGWRSVYTHTHLYLVYTSIPSRINIILQLGPRVAICQSHGSFRKRNTSERIEQLHRTELNALYSHLAHIPPSIGSQSGRTTINTTRQKNTKDTQLKLDGGNKRTASSINIVDWLDPLDYYSYLYIENLSAKPQPHERTRGMRKRRELDYGYDGPNGDRIKDTEDYNGIMESESGPSRITIDDLERMERKRWRSSPRPSPKRRIALGLGLALPFLTFAAAAPPAFRETTSIAPTPTPTRLYTRQTLEPEARIDEEEIDYDIQYLTSMSTPTQALPTNVYVVAETRLPFYLSQDQQGSWSKVDNAWLLYGRQAGVSQALGIELMSGCHCEFWTR
jgi:hypothetical protein